MLFSRLHLPLLATFLAVTCPAWAQNYSNGIAATVNGKPISRSEVRDAIKTQEQLLAMQLQNDPDRLKRELASARDNALDALIDRELILIEFTKVGGTIKAQYVDDQINNIVREAFKGDREALVNELAKAGMSMKKFREMQEKNIISSVMRAKQAGEPPPPTPAEVEDYYRKNVDKWRVGDQVKISTISIPKFSSDADSSVEKQRKIAEELRTKIVGGADFATIARSYSADSRAEFGGAWEWMPRTELDPTISTVAMNLKVGGVSSVVEKETNFILISCDAKKLGEAPALEKVRTDIQKMIQQEKSKKSVDEWMQTLRKKAIVRKF
jgi:peptidyl-prolyl cis-trans isomerase SurA